jgi:acid-sensing ion channel, other
MPTGSGDSINPVLPQSFSRVFQSYMMKFCNCSVAFFYPAVGYPECNVAGLLCLITYNDIFNAEKPQGKNPYFDETEGIECQCLPRCSRIDYTTEMSQIIGEKKVHESSVLIDVHYATSTMLKYRTDVTFSFMDLIVGFGGIVSLFLGCSILSGFEIVYFSTVALFWHRKRIQAAQARLTKKIRAQLPFVH